MNSQPKIVVTSAPRAPGNVRQGERGIAPAEPCSPLRAVAGIGALGLCLGLLAACGQKGSLYLPDQAPASHRPGAAHSSAAAASFPAGTASPSSTPASRP